MYTIHSNGNSVTLQLGNNQNYTKHYSGQGTAGYQLFKCQNILLTLQFLIIFMFIC